MSDTRKRWIPPEWFSAENTEREERLLKAVRDLMEASRAAAFRLESQSDVSAWEARMTGATKDAEEWIGRFDRIAPPPSAA